MELVGITVFCEAPADAREQGARPGSTRMDVADVRNRLAFGKRVKGLAVQYTIDRGAQVTDDNDYAVLRGNGGDGYICALLATAGLWVGKQVPLEHLARVRRKAMFLEQRG